MTCRWVLSDLVVIRPSSSDRLTGQLKPMLRDISKTVIAINLQFGELFGNDM